MDKYIERLGMFPVFFLYFIAIIHNFIKIMAKYCVYAIFFVPLCAIFRHSKASDENHMF